MLKYESKFYIVFLTSIITVLSIYNIVTLLFYLNYISIIPIALQLPILYCIYKKRKELKLFVKIWSIILLIGGIAGWVSIISTLGLKELDAEFNQESLGIFNLVIQSLRVMIPIYFLMFLNESIVEVNEASNNKVLSESDIENSV
ncbi:MAG: hypothetical protein CMF23_08860 [Ignavibacteriae bacterium]|nr:hypothetical protein [Ignavibacteriota bacterium]